MPLSLESAMAHVLTGQEDRFPGLVAKPTVDRLPVDYPKMLYHTEHSRPLVVGDQKQEESARADGWNEFPGGEPPEVPVMLPEEIPPPPPKVRVSTGTTGTKPVVETEPEIKPASPGKKVGT